MLKLEPSTRFKKDVKHIFKSPKFKESEFKYVIHTLMNEQVLESKYLDHQLSGNWDGYRECHVQNDLLLIYKVEHGKLLLTRLGTHATLFG